MNPEIQAEIDRIDNNIKALGSSVDTRKQMLEGARDDYQRAMRMQEQKNEGTARLLSRYESILNNYKTSLDDALRRVEKLREDMEELNEERTSLPKLPKHPGTQEFLEDEEGHVLTIIAVHDEYDEDTIILSIGTASVRLTPEQAMLVIARIQSTLETQEDVQGG